MSTTARQNALKTAIKTKPFTPNSVASASAPSVVLPSEARKLSSAVLESIPEESPLPTTKAPATASRSGAVQSSNPARSGAVQFSNPARSAAKQALPPRRSNQALPSVQSPSPSPPPVPPAVGSTTGEPSAAPALKEKKRRSSRVPKPLAARQVLSMLVSGKYREALKSAAAVVKREVDHEQRVRHTKHHTHHHRTKHRKVAHGTKVKSVEAAAPVKARSVEVAAPAKAKSVEAAAPAKAKPTTTNRDVKKTKVKGNDADVKRKHKRHSSAKKHKSHGKKHKRRR